MLSGKFGFEHPYLLFFLFVIPVVAWALFARRKSRPGLLFPALARSMEAAKKLGHSHAIFWIMLLRALALACLIVALAGPRFGSETREIKSSGIDIMLDMDISGSMLAIDLDWNGSKATRVEVVKNVITDFIQKRPSDRIGLVAFGTEPYLVSPLTLEHEWLLDNIKRIEVGMVDSGTSIGPPLGMSINRLKADTKSKSRIVILLTDGEDSVQAPVPPVKYAEAAAALGIKVYTIAIGKGGLVPSYYLDRQGNLVKNMLGLPDIRYLDFPIDEQVLKDMAAKGGGKFYRARDVDDLKKIYDEIDKLEKSDVTLTYHTDYADAWAYPLMAGLALLVLEQLLSASVFRTLP
jgi:Ca-activated chloride channel family protein